MDKIRVSAVSYTNTKAFVYGLQHSGILDKIDLSLDIPSQCADKLITDRADIGLVPVAALLSVPHYHIISDFCIGADGPVDSVFIFSEKPIEEVKSIRLDSQSRTSNGLARVLLKHFWQTEPEIMPGDADAFVEIGDRTFGKKDKYPYVYDLAEQWKLFTGLPFVFAAWTANKELDKKFVEEFNDALRIGMQNIEEILKTLPVREDFDLRRYFTKSLDFNLNSEKREALERYLQLLRALP